MGIHNSFAIDTVVLSYVSTFQCCLHLVSLLLVPEAEISGEKDETPLSAFYQDGKIG